MKENVIQFSKKKITRNEAKTLASGNIRVTLPCRTGRRSRIFFYTFPANNNKICKRYANEFTRVHANFTDL